MSSQLPVTYFSDFHKESIYFQELEKHGKIKVSNIYTPAGDPVLIETPRLKVSRIVLDEENNESGFAEFTFPADSQDFYDFITELDDHCKESCCENSRSWFGGRELSQQFVEDAYKTCIMPPRKSGMPCRLKIDLPVKYNKLQSKIFNQYEKPVPISNAENNSVVCILRLARLEVSRFNLKCVWELEQMKVFQKKQRLEECRIKNIPEDEKWISDEDEEEFADMVY